MKEVQEFPDLVSGMFVNREGKTDPARIAARPQKGLVIPASAEQRRLPQECGSKSLRQRVSLQETNMSDLKYV